MMRRRTLLTSTTALAVTAIGAPAEAGPRRPGSGGLALRGADISTLKKSLDKGAVYRDARGRRADPLALLAAGGVNAAQRKVWVNPADGYNSKATVLAMAARAKAAGMKLFIDFHYSDAWADPGKQNKPAAWASLPFPQLRDALYQHTADVLGALRAQGTRADLVQIGNEINGGMLWPDGRWDNWPQLSELLAAGSTAARSVSPGTRVVLHLAEGGNNAQHRWWFDNAVSYGVPFDVIAVSHYLYWHGAAASLASNLADLSARYDRDVIVAETAYGFTTAQDDFEPQIFTDALAATAGLPATPAGQVTAFRTVCDIVAGVPNGRGIGVFYWEPTWTAVPGAGWDPADPASGNGWENQAWFDFNDRALPAQRVYNSFR
jgi:arabinogalactan endo-1,4-beta-galactosidase